MKKTILLYLLLISFLCRGQLDTVFTVNTGNWYTANAYQAKLAKDLGAYCAGQDGGVFNWRDIQSNINNTNTATWNWSKTDSCVRALQSNGIDLYVTLRSIPPTNSTFSNSCTSGFGTSTIAYSWLSDNADSTKWKYFVTAVVDRYNNDGTNDMTGLPSLTKAIYKWRIETEWQSYWCSANSPTSAATAAEFVKYVNMTYNTIKSKQPTSIVSFAGMDTQHDKAVFINNYTNESSFCFSSNCTSTVGIPNSALATGTFTAKKANMIYIIKNAKYDELDIHSYGRYKYIPKVKKWLQDTCNVTKPIVFLEGGGPFCDLCEISSNQAQLVRWNSSYVVFYFLTGLASKIQRMSWHISPEYKSFNASFGDMDLQDSLKIGGAYKKRASYFTYRFLAKTIFSNSQADSVVLIPDANPNIIHYQIMPLGLHAVWSLNSSDTYTASGPTVNRWDIPTCITPSTTPCDTAVMYTPSASNIITLNNGVPVFYASTNLLGIKNSVNSLSENINIYPNPFNNSFIIDAGYSNEFINTTLKVYNTLGVLIYNQTLQNQKTEVDLSSFPKGIYSVKIESKNGIISKKLIKN